MQLYFIFSLIASIVVIIFAITNAAAVPVRIFFAEYELSLALVIFISTAFGAIIASMLGLVRLVKQKLQINRLQHENQTLLAEQKKLELELTSLQPSLQTPEENKEIIKAEVNTENE